MLSKMLLAFAYYSICSLFRETSIDLIEMNITKRPSHMIMLCLDKNSNWTL